MSRIPCLSCCLLDQMNQFDHIKDSLRSIFDEQIEGVIFAYLFGSQARSSNAYPPKDIDLAVYFEEKSGECYLDAKLNLYGLLSRALNFNDFDIMVLNTATNLVLLEEISRKGILLIDRDPDLRKNFEQRILHQALDFKFQRAAIIGV